MGLVYPDSETSLHGSSTAVSALKQSRELQGTFGPEKKRNILPGCVSVIVFRGFTSEGKVFLARYFVLEWDFGWNCLVGIVRVFLVIVAYLSNWCVISTGACVPIL